MNKIKKFLLFFLILEMIPVHSVMCQSKVDIYFFHSNTCSHCESEEKLLEKLEKSDSNIEIHKYEIHNQENLQLLEKICSYYKIGTSGVPVTIIGEKVYSGYSEEKSELKFRKAIAYYKRYGYSNEVQYLIEGKDVEGVVGTENSISLDKFMKTYKNYHLIFGINSDDVDKESVAIIAGIKSVFSLPVVLGSLILLFIIVKFSTAKEKMLAFMGALLSLLMSEFLISMNLRYCSYLIIGIILFIQLVRYIKGKFSCHKLFLAIILALIIFFNINVSNQAETIFIEIKSLYQLSGFDFYLYQINFLTSYLFALVLWWIALYWFMKKINFRGFVDNLEEDNSFLVK